MCERLIRPGEPGEVMISCENCGKPLWKDTKSGEGVCIYFCNPECMDEHDEKERVKREEENSRLCAHIEGVLD